MSLITKTGENMAPSKNPRSLQALRSKNKKKIIDILRKDEMSSSDISRALNLSIAGTASLVEDLVNNGFLVKVRQPKGNRGRTPLILKINPDYGCVVVVDLSAFTYATICICDFCGEVRYSERLDATNRDFLNTLIGTLHRIVDEKSFVLYAITVASVGMVEKKSGKIKFASFRFDYKDIDIKGILSHEFGVPVEIKNSILFSLAAELRYNKDIDSDYVMFAHDMGSAFSFNGKIYEGKNGFVGETGFMIIDVYDAIKNDGFINSYRSDYLNGAFNGLLSIAYNICGKEIFGNKEFDDITNNDLVNAYYTGDKKIVSLVDRYIKIYSIALNNIALTMDINRIILSGFVTEFGQKTINIFNETLDERVTEEKLDIDVSFPKVKDSVIKGATNYAIDMAFGNLL